MSNLLLEDLGKFKKFTLKQYKTVEELECASWDNEISVQDLMEEGGSHSVVDNKGNESEMSWADIKGSKERMGYWGFIDSRDNTIHFWVKSDYNITLEELLFFFGHEMGHQMEGGIMPDQKEYSENHEIHFKEEHRADEYGYVTLIAYKFATEILKSHTAL